MSSNASAPKFYLSAQIFCQSLCFKFWFRKFSQFSHSVVSDSLWPHESQHARPPCPSPTPRVHPNSCASSQWCFVRLFATSWTAACQASLSCTISQNLLNLMCSKSMMPSSHLILCRPLLLLPPIPPSIRVFSNESALPMRWPKYWSFSFSIIPSKLLEKCKSKWQWDITSHQS